jgi:hypothetical protein
MQMVNQFAVFLPLGAKPTGGSVPKLEYESSI